METQMATRHRSESDVFSIHEVLAGDADSRATERVSSTDELLNKSSSLHQSGSDKYCNWRLRRCMALWTLFPGVPSGYDRESFSSDLIAGEFNMPIFIGDHNYACTCRNHCRGDARATGDAQNTHKTLYHEI